MFCLNSLFSEVTYNCCWCSCYFARLTLWLVDHSKHQGCLFIHPVSRAMEGGFCIQGRREDPVGNAGWEHGRMGNGENKNSQVQKGSIDIMKEKDFDREQKKRLGKESDWLSVIGDITTDAKIQRRTLAGKAKQKKRKVTKPERREMMRASQKSKAGRQKLRWTSCCFTGNISRLATFCVLCWTHFMLGWVGKVADSLVFDHFWVLADHF